MFDADFSVRVGVACGRQVTVAFDKERDIRESAEAVGLDLSTEKGFRFGLREVDFLVLTCLV